MQVSAQAGRPGADQIWYETTGAGTAWCAGRPALFVDRDGVLVDETHYLHRVEDMVVIEGAARSIGAANRLGMPVIVVTNQAGIGRGYYGWDDFAAVNAAILAALGAGGARVDAVLACPFHQEGQGIYRHGDHPMRKPNPGMLLRAGACLGVDLGASLMIGDQAGDIAAARAAGLPRAVHVMSGHGQRSRADALALACHDFAVLTADSIGAPSIGALLEHTQGREHASSR